MARLPILRAVRFFSRSLAVTCRRKGPNEVIFPSNADGQTEGVSSSSCAPSKRTNVEGLTVPRSWLSRSRPGLHSTRRLMDSCLKPDSGLEAALMLWGGQYRRSMLQRGATPYVRIDGLIRKAFCASPGTLASPGAVERPFYSKQRISSAEPSRKLAHIQGEQRHPDVVHICNGPSGTIFECVAGFEGFVIQTRCLAIALRA
jgi:hypothetical protein